jgi:lysyl-tRNA synthetase class 2
VPNFVREFEHLKKGETLPDKEIRVGVRIMTKREAST